MAESPLAGLVVLDISTVIAGPLTASLLAEYGATVVKVEHPQYGDGSRNTGSTAAARGLWWKFLSRNKQCVTLNLSDPEGAELLLEMAAKADILIENFRPGTLERWGIGPSALHNSNPGLIILRVSGFGQDGPYAQRPGYGTIIEAMSGLANMTGDPNGPPTLPGIPIADGLAAYAGCSAIMIALRQRDHGGAPGRGEVIDLALYSPMLYLMGLFVVEYDQLGASPPRRGNRFGQAPRNICRTLDDQWIAYAAMTPGMLDSIVDLVGLQDDPRFKPPKTALDYGEILDEALGCWIAKRALVEAVEELSVRNIPVTPVYSIEQLMQDEHIVARGDILSVPDDDVDRIRMPRGPFRFSRSSAEVNFTGRSRGYDTVEFYEHFVGLDSARILQLRKRGVI